MTILYDDTRNEEVTVWMRNVKLHDIRVGLRESPPDVQAMVVYDLDGRVPSEKHVHKEIWDKGNRRSLGQSDICIHIRPRGSHNTTIYIKGLSWCVCQRTKRLYEERQRAYSKMDDIQRVESSRAIAVSSRDDFRQYVHNVLEDIEMAESVGNA